MGITLNDRSADADTGTQAIARAAALLREVAAGPKQGSRAVDLANNLALRVPTVHRILRRLVAENILVQDPSSKLYRIGSLIYEIGLGMTPPHVFHTRALEALNQVALNTGDTAFLYVHSGLDGVCLARQEGAYRVRGPVLSPGHRRPLGTGAGSLAMMSAMQGGDIEKVLASNRHKLDLLGELNNEKLMALIEQAHHDGHLLKAPIALPEVLSLAVPVLDAYGAPMYALSISALTPRVLKRIDFLTDSLQRAASALLIGQSS